MCRHIVENRVPVRGVSRNVEAQMAGMNFIIKIV